MKLELLTMLGAVAIVTAASATGAAAQSPSLPKGDAAGFIAWLGTKPSTAEPADRDEWHSNFFGGASLGVYWTPHIKSEIDIGAGSTSDSYRNRAIQVGDLVAYQASRLESSRRTISLSQLYQFDDNAWFHPHAAVGVNLTWERTTEFFYPRYFVDRTIGPFLDGGGTTGPTTNVAVRPFVAAGFKLYVTPRWFARADARLAFQSGLDEGQVRVGIGRDF